MNIPTIPLMEWLIKSQLKACYNLGSSNIQGVLFDEYQKYTGYSIPPAFDMGINFPYGATELKNTLAEIYQCSHENIVTSNGGSESNLLVFLTLLKVGDECIVETPGYQPLWLTPEMLGARVRKCPRIFENKFLINQGLLEELISTKTKLIILSNLHNPTGTLIDRGTLRAVSRIAQKYGIYVLIDEIFLDGAFTSQKSAFGLPNTIITSSLSKIYGLGGLRTGWIIAPEEISLKCQRAKAHTCVASSYLSEVMNATIFAMARENLLELFHRRAKNNLEIVKDWIDDHPGLLEWVEPQGGIMCFPRYMVNYPSKKLCEMLLEKEGVLVCPGEYFGLDGHFRLTYGCNENELLNGLEALKKGLRNHTHHFQ